MPRFVLRSIALFLRNIYSETDRRDVTKGKDRNDGGIAPKGDNRACLAFRLAPNDVSSPSVGEECERLLPTAETLAIYVGIRRFIGFYVDRHTYRSSLGSSGISRTFAAKRDSSV